MQARVGGNVAEVGKSRSASVVSATDLLMLGKSFALLFWLDLGPPASLSQHTGAVARI